jgi:hypothetical protein
MRARIRSAGSTVAATLVLGLGLGAIPANATQRPVQVAPGGLHEDPGSAGSQTAMYVDPAGTAHIAYVAPGDQSVNLCSIPLGSGTCGDRSVLATDATGTNSGQITSLKYLPDRSSSGNGDAYLAVGIYDLGPNSPPFNPGEQAPYSETQVFPPGSTTGIATGDLFAAADLGSGSSGGDEILAADDSGVDVVGIDQAGTSFNTVAPANSYEFQSLISPSSADSAPVLLGVQSAETPAGQWPFDVTELPNGQTAVLASTYKAYSTAAPPIGMYVQPAGGGAFGPVRQLGISGAAEADFSPGESYVLNIETSAQNHPRTFTDTLGANMELDAFRGTSLRQLAAVGFASDLNLKAFAWAELPPSYADSNGNLYVAWLTRATFDGCPDKAHATFPFYSGCLMYRRIAPGGLLGPKIILSTQGTSDAGVAAPSQPVDGLGAIAVNDKGEGWVLVSRGNSNPTLYAQPLVSSGGPTGAPAVSGSSVSVPLACTGAPGTSCSLTAQLQAPGSGRIAALSARARKPKHPAVYATAKLKLAGGHRKSLKLHLNSAGKRLLARRHHLKLELIVAQSVGAVRTPTTLLQQTVTLRGR